jgi:hypothetical protein
VLDIQNQIKDKAGNYQHVFQPFELHMLDIFLEKIERNIEEELTITSKKVQEILEYPNLESSEEKLHELLQLQHE